MKGWEYYYLYTPKGVARVEFDEAADPENRPNYNWSGRLVAFLPEARTDEAGFPTKEEDEYLNIMEIRLVRASAEAGASARIVGRMIYTAVHEWVVMAENADAFEPIAKSWMQESGHGMEMLREDGWEFFETQIWPDDFIRNQIADRKRMDAGGIGGGKDVTLTFRFSGRTESVNIIREELTVDKFTVVPTEDGSLHLMKKIPANLEAISRLTWALQGFCKDVGAVFEGWEVKSLPVL